jgi:hypothetical protein
VGGGGLDAKIKFLDRSILGMVFVVSRRSRIRVGGRVLAEIRRDPPLRMQNKILLRTWLVRSQDDGETLRRGRCFGAMARMISFLGPVARRGIFP